jgi:hypothetical protein
MNSLMLYRKKSDFINKKNNKISWKLLVDREFNDHDIICGIIKTRKTNIGDGANIIAKLASSLAREDNDENRGISMKS